MSDVIQANPFRCRMWELHDRLGDSVDTKSCADLIASMASVGQKQPALARRCATADFDFDFDFELIYGARRLFAAKTLGINLAVVIRDLDNREALIEMDIENRVRSDISPYERGLSYRRWLNAGYFKAQKDIARSLGISEAQVSRLLCFAELPSVLVAAFSTPSQIREEWAVHLAKRCRSDPSRRTTIQRARQIVQTAKTRSAQTVYEHLSRESADGPVRSRARCDVIRGSAGKPLFKVGYKARAVHIIVPKHQVSSSILDVLVDQTKKVLDDPVLG